jgi:hypothetical protein
MADEAASACACHEAGPRFPHVISERYVGRDETNGRFADVELIRCGQCSQLWIKYLVEYEGFTASGRWGEALIDEACAMTITAEEAPAYIEAAPWLIYGGSYYGHAGRRGVGRVRWDL